MASKSQVSLSVVRRLPRYYRFLSELKRAGRDRISSRELAKIMGLTASQIRQDLNCFGGFGQQGYGYNVGVLREQIENILGLDDKISTIIIGVGNLGRAVAAHMDFEKRGFVLTGLFDNDVDIIGKSVSGVVIQSMDSLEKFCKENKPTTAILCIPKTVAKGVCDKLISLGIKCFWNFSHYDLSVDNPDLIVENVHLSDSLMTLGYRIKENNK